MESPNFLHRLARVVSVFSGLLLFVSWGCSRESSAERDNWNGEIRLLTKHWETAIPNQEIPEDLESLSASECGECHEEIYREWQSSNHAIALQDLQFQAEWAKDDSLWVCLNCHTPLQNQQEFIILGIRDGDYFKPVKEENPYYDPQLREESITCAVCHVRGGAVIGTRGDQEAAPHKVKKDTRFLSSEFCLTCHNITDVLTPTLVCSFQSGEEWSSGPYPEMGRNCVSCHMPVVYRPLAVDEKARMTRRHTWVGSAVPKFIGSDSIANGYKSGLDVEIQTFSKKITAGDSAFFTVSVANQKAGHHVPTGDPEYFLTIHLRLTDERQNIIRDTTLKIGQEWKWWPRAEKFSDNRLKPLEQRVYTLAGVLPPGPGKFYWEVIITSHRMTIENATVMGLMGKYPIEAVIFHKKIGINDAKEKGKG